MEVNDFDAMRISLASPEEIFSLSYGEVLKPETINYRTLRPERDGLFCERIFGPTKDWECYCGKYKRVRYRGIVCDKCGVEVAPSRVRRERMGHIKLASPVSHIWYVKGVPSRLGLLLNISPRNLERILYFAQYIITNVDEEARGRILTRMEKEMASRTSKIEAEAQQKIEAVEQQRDEKLEQLAAQQAEIDQEAEDSLAALTEQVMNEAGKVQRRLDRRMDKQVTTPVVFEPTGTLIAEKRTVIIRDHLTRLTEAVQGKLSEIESEVRQQQGDRALVVSAERDHILYVAEQKIEEIERWAQKEIEAIRSDSEDEIAELKSLEERQLLSESHYQELSGRWGNVFKAGMGAEAIYDLMAKIDLGQMAKELRREVRTSRSKQRRKKAAKRLRVVGAFLKSGNRPEWMILTVLPVIPPDLRPMVQLDGGRFATSDLNDLYRRVINRNNRLRRLLELGAPDVIVRNEKRMLQEAVDSLIDNGRRGRAVSRSGKRKLKSLSDMLKGKQGRFRRNLLGKRVDYSGRSVIVIGPDLKLHQCGLPKKMALELFKPFVMRRLVEYNYAHNIKSAKRLVDRESPEVWDVLEEITKERPVLLNRAPTLHRLGIQAFEVALIEGSAIQIHPLVCAAFNADFDGDQMAVHVPLSDAAVREARELMLSSHNLLLPANGEPVVGPSKDMVLGCHYMTVEKEGAKGEGKVFADFDEVALAYDLGEVDLRARIKVRFRTWNYDTPVDALGLSERTANNLVRGGITTAAGMLNTLKSGRKVPNIGPKSLEEMEQCLQTEGLIETTVGRVLFNSVLPDELRFVNRVMDKGALKEVVAQCYQWLGPERTAILVDGIKRLGFSYVTRSGMSIAISDITVPEAKARILQEISAQVDEIGRQYRRGLVTEDEQYVKVVELWTRATDDITQAVAETLDPTQGIGAMAASGATKGGIQPIRQLAGMRGLMADPSGRIIALPIQSNFREGLSALEYFLSTHGARKGLADTALRTADAGYLTRRLVDVAQDVIIAEEDCETQGGIWLERGRSTGIGESFRERIGGRVLASDVVDAQTGQVVAEAGTLIDGEVLDAVNAANVESAHVRSPFACQARHGLCRMCYGQDLARGGLINVGEAVGIIAAQSIGEPGTQLTLRTFHTGGVAGTEDITQGLPRVEELFEVRKPKGKAIIAEIEGVVDVYWEGDQRKIKISSSRPVREEYALPDDFEPALTEGQQVSAGGIVARDGEGEEIVTPGGGQVFYEEVEGEDGGTRIVAVVRRDEREEQEEDVPPAARLRVERGQTVKAGQQVTEGSRDPNEILHIQGREAVQMYLLEEVQKVYRSQGVNIHDKHIEVIIRQMLRKVQVRTTGDTDFLPGELVDRFAFEEGNEAVLEAGGQPATARVMLLGITKASLNTESFLAAASFQETTRVLTDAAVRGARDDLRGLKENVIIGKLVPVGTGFSRGETTGDELMAVGMTELPEGEVIEDAEDLDEDEELDDVENVGVEDGGRDR